MQETGTVPPAALPRKLPALVQEAGQHAMALQAARQPLRAGQRHLSILPHLERCSRRTVGSSDTGTKQLGRGHKTEHMQWACAVYAQNPN